MENNRIKPSALRIIQNDYLVFLGLLMPLVFSLLYISVAYLGFMPGFDGREPIQGSQGVLVLLVGVLASYGVGLPLAAFRIRAIIRMFASGLEVQGQVKEVYFFRDRGRVDYVFIYQGSTYTGGCAVMKTRLTKSFLAGIPIVLLINPEAPTRGVLIRDLYI